MRFGSLLIFASCLLGSVSALAVPAPSRGSTSNAVSDSNSSLQSNPVVSGRQLSDSVWGDVLERRRVKIKPPPAKITFSANARKKLDDLNLHGKDRKKVKKWHKEKVKKQMKALGGTHAEIHHLAHAKGSVDPNVHITAQFQQERKTKKGGLIKDPIKNKWNKGPNHHVYVNGMDKTKGVEALHPAYKAAVTAKQHKEGKTTVEFK